MSGIIMQDHAQDLCFGPFRLSRHRRELAGESGPILLGTRAFDLLAALAERPGRLLSKHELLELVWPGIVVEENNLHVQLVALRRALGAQHGVIQTVPGRGYRFIGDLAQPPVADRPDPVDNPASARALPAEQAGLIGRETELAALQSVLGSGRLVTITGPGGIGKTRLGLALGHAVKPQYTTASLVDLAPLPDGNLVEGAVAAALGVRLGGGATPPVERIAAALADRPALLLFDNCEHVLAGVAALADTLLRRCANLAIIATSQEPLRIEAEVTFRLDPLSPAGAAALFIRQVAAADRRLAPRETANETIAEICRRLDGIPLALEMAAARVPALGLEGLRQRLNERLKMLAGGRTAAARHRTLRNTVNWSYELLEAADRALFRRLGIFAGGFSAAAAAAVLARPGEDEWVLLDALSRLIDKSLVAADPGESPRYRLLETLRLFALEQLAAHREQPDIARRHAEHFDQLLARAYESWEHTDDATWLAAIAPELDNARAALDWALEHDHTLAISLAGTAARLWDLMSLLAEGRDYLRRAETLLSPATPPALAARLHRQIGNLWQGSDRPAALAALRRAEAIYRRLGEPGSLGAVLALAGSIHGFMGDSTAATAHMREASALLAQSGCPKALLNVTNNLGVQVFIDGDMAAARGIFEQALQFARREQNRGGEVLVLMNLAEVDFNLGAVDRAVAQAHAAVGHLRASNRGSDLGGTLVNLASYLLITERLAEAVEAAREALHLVRPVSGFILRICLQQWALLAVIAGQAEEAALLLGFVNAGYEAANEIRQATEQKILDALQARLNDALTPANRRSLETEGANWTEAQAAALATRLSTDQFR